MDDLRRFCFGLFIILLLFKPTLQQTQVLKLSSRIERVALLQLRSSLGLRSKDWPIKADPCSVWIGIQCQNGNVIGINISGFRRTRIGSRNPQFNVNSLALFSGLLEFNASRFLLPGSIPEWFGQRLRTLQVLDLRGCSVVGAIPPSFGNMTSLSEMYLSDNDLTGMIPDSLGQLSSLSVLDLSQNGLTGVIPSSFGSLGNLTLLDMSVNFLYGTIPPAIGALSKLEILNLSSNSLSSSIPSQLSDLSSLVDLDLSLNSFSGSVAPDFRDLRNLQKMVIGRNQLSGFLPDNMFAPLTQLQFVVLSHNNFTGEIPGLLWSMPSLRFLDASANNFTGILPNLSFVPGANSPVFNLSRNMLYGGLTTVVRRFSFIDLSDNYFQGKVPDYARSNASLAKNCLRDQSSQRATSPCASFYAERGLVFDNFGVPNATQPPPSKPHKSSHKKLIILAAVLGSVGLIALIIIVLVLLIVCTRKGTATRQRGTVVEPVLTSASPPPPGVSLNFFRSLRWTSTQILMKSCGAYRSVVAPLSSRVLSCLGKSSPLTPKSEVTSVGGGTSSDVKESGSSMLIYSNYNFLDVKLELQIRSPEGTLIEKQMHGNFSPPGLRFPNGGVIGTNFVVSGTYLTSSKQEYALWALDLHTLTWSRIDAGGSVFSQGSWNRGVLWSRRNTFVILGNRKRSLVEDYNHRRINFTNVCMVELEAFGFYENPRKVSPMSNFISASSPLSSSTIKQALISGWTPGGYTLSAAAEELGNLALGMKQLADMEIICVNGDRIPVNSRIIAKRWGYYFVRLLQEGTATTSDTSDAATLRPPDPMLRSGHRDSNITITPDPDNPMNNPHSLTTIGDPSYSYSGLLELSAIVNPPDVTSLPPVSRPRILFLPHTQLTVQALLHFLYTAALPPSTSPLCTPQILCSLLQIARPYQVDGLLEAVVERLHSILDSRNAAAVFNASAMAAGGCDTLSFIENYYSDNRASVFLSEDDGSYSKIPVPIKTTPPRLTINTSINGIGQNLCEDEPISATESMGSDISSSDKSLSDGGVNKKPNVWSGGISSVIGLQKRGLRGLMEGRRLRERGASSSAGLKDGHGKFRIGVTNSG